MILQLKHFLASALVIIAVFSLLINIIMYSLLTLYGCDVVWMDVRTSAICDSLISGPAKGDKDFLRVSTGE